MGVGMTLEEKLLANERLGGTKKIQTIDYNLLTITILTGHLDEFIASTGTSKGLLGMYLSCSEVFIDEMISGYIPSMKWLAGSNAQVKIAVRQIEKKN